MLLATAEDAGRAVDMFNGYNWQTRTLEVRPDRIAPDFDSPIAIASPAADYHSTSAFHQLHIHPLSESFQGGLLSAPASGLSIPTLTSTLDDGLSLSRPGTASGSGSRNLFVGNVWTPCRCNGSLLSSFYSFRFTASGRILKTCSDKQERLSEQM